MPAPGLNKKMLFHHLKIAGGAVLITFIFSFIIFRKIFHEETLNTMFLTFIQLEIFLYLGQRFFRNVKPEGSGFIKKIV